MKRWGFFFVAYCTMVASNTIMGMWVTNVSLLSSSHFSIAFLFVATLMMLSHLPVFFLLFFKRATTWMNLLVSGAFTGIIADLFSVAIRRRELATILSIDAISGQTFVALLISIFGAVAFGAVMTVAKKLERKLKGSGVNTVRLR